MIYIYYMVKGAVWQLQVINVNCYRIKFSNETNLLYAFVLCHLFENIIFRPNLYAYFIVQVS
jgi:hypothetical protein